MDAFRRALFLAALALVATALAAQGQPSIQYEGPLQPQASVGPGYAAQAMYPVSMQPQPYLIRNEGVRRPFQVNGGVRCVAFSPSGKFLAAGGFDNMIHLWGVASGTELRQLLGHQQAILCIAFSPDGKMLASGSFDRTIRLWDLAAGKEIRRLTGHGREVMQVAFSPDGKTLASASLDGTVRLWQPATGKEMAQATGHQGEVFCVAFAPDGQTFASGGADRTVRLWETATAREQRRFEGSTGPVNAVAFSPEGQQLATAGLDQGVRLWSVPSGKQLRLLSGHQGAVQAVAFSPDGRTLASGAQDRSIRLWELATGQECRRLLGHYGWVWSVKFSSDGRTVASASEDQTARLWDLGEPLSGPGLPPATLPAKQMEELWSDLASADAARAYRAIWILAEAGDAAIPFLHEHLPKENHEAAIDPEHVAALLAELDNDQFTVREKAMDELEKLGPPIEPVLHKALARKHSAELDLRLHLLLDNLQAPVLSPDRLRFLRTLAVLEHIGDVKARQEIAALAEASRDDSLTQEAKATLNRLPEH